MPTRRRRMFAGSRERPKHSFGSAGVRDCSFGRPTACARELSVIERPSPTTASPVLRRPEHRPHI